MGRQRRWPTAKQVAYLLVLPLMSASSVSWALEADISGVDGRVLVNIEAYLENIEADQYTDARLEGEIRQRTQEAMRVYGYYEPDITVELDQPPIAVRIESGPQVVIEVLDISITGDANNDPPFQDALDDFPLKQGEPLRHAPWDSLRSQFAGLAIERGYFDWGFSDRRMEVRPYLESARLYMAFDSGPRYHFGDTFITGSHIEPERLRQMQTFRAGEPYLAESLARYNQRLAETGWFSSVSVRPRLETAQELTIAPPSGGSPWWNEATASQPERSRVSSAALASALSINSRDDTRLPIDVSVEPADRHQFEVGIGYATDVGPRLRFGWQQPWINRFGHSLDPDLYLSAPEQRFTG